MEEITRRLFSMQDSKYRLFQIKLMPTVSPDRVIGVRTPMLREYAKEIAASPCAREFLNELPHAYYEEDNLHAFILEKIKDFDETVSALDAFLPYVDNWATCDSMKPRSLLKNIEGLEKTILRWLASGKTYTVRFGIEMLMNNFLDERFDIKYPEFVAGVHSDEYYVKMMQAWYFATALAKRYEEVLPYLFDGKLDRWVHNKTIQKACESYRISPEQKESLKKMRLPS